MALALAHQPSGQSYIVENYLLSLLSFQFSNRLVRGKPVCLSLIFIDKRCLQTHVCMYLL